MSRTQYEESMSQKTSVGTEFARPLQSFCAAGLEALMLMGTQAQQADFLRLRKWGEFFMVAFLHSSF
jgi:hypothetical protein